MKTSEPDAKRPNRILHPQQVKLLYDIGKYIARDAEEMTRLGWKDFVGRGQVDFASLSAVEHLARQLLRQYKPCSAVVMLLTGEWMEEERLEALALGPCKSAIEHDPFLRKEFALMVEKWQWTVIPYLVAKLLLVLRLSPPWMKVEKDRMPLCLIDYSFYKTNAETLPVACLYAMQYIRALDRLLHEIACADPSFGPIYPEGGRVGLFLPYWSTPRKTQPN